MFLGTYRVAGILAALSLSAILMVPTLASAQDRNGGGYSGRSSQTRTRQTTKRTGNRGRTTHTHTVTTRYGSSHARTAPTSYARNRYGTTRTTMSSSQSQAFNRRRQSATSWRDRHPSWSGNYYYNNGNYYFDSGYAYPAIISNEWMDIAVNAGGPGLAVNLSNDPSLYFNGSTGAFFSMNLYNADEYGNSTDRLRHAYFSRPYFWRNGTRFDRITVTHNGEQGYEFRRQ